jgi:hypothetical protein
MHKRLYYDDTRAIYWYYRYDGSIALYCMANEANDIERTIAHERVCPVDITG